MIIAIILFVIGWLMGWTVIPCLLVAVFGSMFIRTYYPEFNKKVETMLKPKDSTN